MCIRDRTDTIKALLGGGPDTPWGPLLASNALLIGVVLVVCLLYTSDAADERSSVDLGGRRIIKKKSI